MKVTIEPLSVSGKELGLSYDSCSFNLPPFGVCVTLLTEGFVVGWVPRDFNKQHLCLCCCQQWIRQLWALGEWCRHQGGNTLIDIGVRPVPRRHGRYSTASSLGLVGERTCYIWSKQRQGCHGAGVTGVMPEMVLSRKPCGKFRTKITSQFYCSQSSELLKCPRLTNFTNH